MGDGAGSTPCARTMAGLNIWGGVDLAVPLSVANLDQWHCHRCDTAWGLLSPSPLQP